MEVIKRGDWQPPTFTAELVCYNCRSILKIDADDILSVYDDWDGSYANQVTNEARFYSYQVQCPVCGHYVVVAGKDKKNYLNYLRTRKLN